MAKFGTLYLEGTTSKLYFDQATTVLNETHSFANEVVTQTLEDGSPISDHIVIQQDELEVQIFISNSVVQKSQEVYALLKTMRNTRELCKVYTDHEIYGNMAIESVSAPHEAPMVNELRVTVKFKRVDYAGSVQNEYPVCQFEDVPEIGDEENWESEEAYLASEGQLGDPAAVDQTASKMEDVGELTAEGVTNE